MATAAPTKPGTSRLSELARHVVVPSGIVATGWPAVRDKCAELGIEFDTWQDGAGRLILAKREDGLYATTVGGVVMSIPRQVGKTFLLGAIIFALCLLFPNLTVIWTAHRLRTADETFSAMQGFSRRRKIAPHMLRPVLGSGDEEIRFRNGSRILFGARERGFGRGFAGVDVLVFDEAQILTENAIDDMVPATNQAPNPLILFTGTPPKPTDSGEVFRLKRADALAGESDDTVYIEFSADLGADPLDREQWRRANPSFPARTPAAAMLRMKKNLSEDSFIREALGIWDAGGDSVIPAHVWAAALDSGSEPASRPVFAVDVSVDRGFAAIAAAGLREDGKMHVEVVEHRPGVEWVSERLTELRRKHRPAGIVVDQVGPAGSLLPDLQKCRVETTTARDMIQACGAFYDLAMTGRLAHRGQVALDEALKVARKRELMESWAWARKGGDITPLVACTLAAWMAAKLGAVKPRFVNLAEALEAAESAED